MPRGGKRGHKHGARRFTDSDTIDRELDAARKKQAWREAHPDSDSEEEEEEKGAVGQKSKKPINSRGQPGELPPSESEEESESEEDDGEKKAKGVSHLIEVANPNRVVKKYKKIKDLTLDDIEQPMSRKEREEQERQKEKMRYQKLHSEGKTDEARADLARLAIIRKQREELAQKKEQERLAKEAAKAKSKSK